MTFLDFFNEIALIANPALRTRQRAADPQQLLKETDIDSLDLVMISVYLCEAYKIPEEVGKAMPLGSVAEVQQFIELHKGVTPESFEAALEAMR